MHPKKKSITNDTLLLPTPSRRATDLVCILPPISLVQVTFDFSFLLHIKMSKRFTESLKKMITAVNQVIFKTSRVLGPSDPRPIDESDCYNEEGSFNLNQYEEYIEREEEEAVFKRNVRFLMLLVQLFEYSRRRRKAKAVRRRMLKPPVKRARIRHPKFLRIQQLGFFAQSHQELVFGGFYTFKIQNLRMHSGPRHSVGAFDCHMNCFSRCFRWSMMKRTILMIAFSDGESMESQTEK